MRPMTLTICVTCNNMVLLYVLTSFEGAAKIQFFLADGECVCVWGGGGGGGGGGGWLRGGDGGSSRMLTRP